MPLSDLWHLFGRRRDCDRTSVSFTHLLWKSPVGSGGSSRKSRSPGAHRAFCLVRMRPKDWETRRLRDVFPRIVIPIEVEGSLLHNAYQHACGDGEMTSCWGWCYGFPHIHHFPVCKKDLSATLEMTVRENARLTFVFNPSRRRWQRRMPLPRIVIPTEVEGSLLHNGYQACMR